MLARMCDILAEREVRMSNKGHAEEKSRRNPKTGKTTKKK